MRGLPLRLYPFIPSRTPGQPSQTMPTPPSGHGPSSELALNPTPPSITVHITIYCNYLFALSFPSQVFTPYSSENILTHTMNTQALRTA